MALWDTVAHSTEFKIAVIVLVSHSERFDHSLATRHTVAEATRELISCLKNQQEN